MPLLRKQPFKRLHPAKGLRPEEEVFFCEATKEVFRDYDEFFHWVEPNAGAICAMRFKGPLSSNELGEQLALAGIAMKPAYCYSDLEVVPKEKDYFRVGFGEEKMPKALEAFRQFVEDHKKDWRKQMSG